MEKDRKHTIKDPARIRKAKERLLHHGPELQAMQSCGNLNNKGMPGKLQ